MELLDYRYHIVRPAQGGAPVAFFRSQATWEAAKEAPPGARALLAGAGFVKPPPGGKVPEGWWPAERQAYFDMMTGMQAALEKIELPPPGLDGFRLEQFLAQFRQSIPEKITKLDVNAGKVPGKGERLKWGVGMVAVCGALGIAIFMGGPAMLTKVVSMEPMNLAGTNPADRDGIRVPVEEIESIAARTDLTAEEKRAMLQEVMRRSAAERAGTAPAPRTQSGAVVRGSGDSNGGFVNAGDNGGFVGSGSDSGGFVNAGDGGGFVSTGQRPQIEVEGRVQGSSDMRAALERLRNR
ncbi:hypothetical protein [Jannaschia aquimarina]|uniref:Uncharacterized protein n=1 Tax=Jannaschia aquimarina TaxID=935700 RepID=A0A0D1EKB4_9RHOB|nr:hypothetical protein [Jannaschia aquimarina]KIT18024.1 hypothetical protein jaqu_02510 [Jannaschia aquimarina]SNS88749.1 hypothetical protein SAMN05421775_103173 [Jannaschia aquimarina]